MEDLLKDLFGIHYTNISKFSFDYIERHNSSDSNINSAFKYFLSLGANLKKLSKHAALLGLEKELIQDNYENLIRLGFKSPIIIKHLELLGINKDKIIERYNHLIEIGIKHRKIISFPSILGLTKKNILNKLKFFSALGIKTQKINTHLILLARDLRALQDNYNHLLELGITSVKLSKHIHLIGLSKENINTKYEYLVNLGIKPTKIATHVHLLGMNRETIEDHYENLINLSLSPEKVATHAVLLGYNPVTLQNKNKTLKKLGMGDLVNKLPYLLYLDPLRIMKTKDYLVSIGIVSNRLSSCMALFSRNLDSIRENYRYYTQDLKINKETIIKFPNLLGYNPDGFAKKMRIIKQEIIGLSHTDDFDLNKYIRFYSISLPTILAKRRFCMKNNLFSKKNLSVLTIPWHKLTQKLNLNLDKNQAGELGRDLTTPIKKEFHEYMKVYKNWATQFYSRRGRRLILKV
ncbi:MAG: hypothetical protein ACXAB8_11115 [Promethearchaeota archaeon]|jgi:hypothetical protein